MDIALCLVGIPWAVFMTWANLYGVDRNRRRRP